MKSTSEHGAQRRSLLQIAGVETTRLAGTMKTLTQELWMSVPARRGIVSIHDEVERLVVASGVQEGLVLVNTKQI